MAIATKSRVIRAPRGTEISCRGWQQEAVLRMLMNNLDPEVAENPDQLVVYGGARRGAPARGGVHALARAPPRPGGEETPPCPARQPPRGLPTHPRAPPA